MNRMKADPIYATELELGKKHEGYEYELLLQQEQKRYRNIFEILGAAYWEWSEKEGFYHSEMYEEYAISGMNPEKIFDGKTVLKYIYKDDIEQLKKFMKFGLDEKEKKTVIVRCKMKNGSYRWTEMTSIFEINEDGKLVRLIIVMRDVNSNWIKQHDELEKAYKNEEAANKAKTAFLSRVSHDMRTPMNGILGMAKLSEDETDVTTLKGNMKKIQDSGEYLLNLINDTLDIQRIESGRIVLAPEIVKILDIIESVNELMKRSAKEKGVELKINAHDANLDDYIRVDTMRVKQVFVNLLSNAIKFTPEGGTIEVELNNVESKGMIDHYVISVSDTGIGMSKEFIQKGIFQPFSQESNAVSTYYVGSGLGLSIAKSIIEMMGGTIEVESELGSGTTFSISIDIERVNKEDAVQKSQTQKVHNNDVIAMLDQKTILLVEDHPLNAEIAKKLLEKVGCNVVWVTNGQEAVEGFEKASINTFDSILMDIRMPVMDGLEATRRIRALDKADAATTPIIAMTANAYEEDIKECIDAGMNAHLRKPIEPNIMYSEIARQINLA